MSIKNEDILSLTENIIRRAEFFPWKLGRAITISVESFAHQRNIPEPSAASAIHRAVECLGDVNDSDDLDVLRSKIVQSLSESFYGIK